MARFYHVTSRTAAESVLRAGFRDSTGTYGTPSLHTGAFLSNLPCWDGGQVVTLSEGLFCLEVETADEFSDCERVEDGKPYREGTFPRPG